MRGFIDDVRQGYSPFPQAVFHTFQHALSTAHMLFMCIRLLRGLLDFQRLLNPSSFDRAPPRPVRAPSRRLRSAERPRQ